eukprot:1992158-Amphidinium_carterae.1
MTMSCPRLEQNLSKLRLRLRIVIIPIRATTHLLLRNCVYAAVEQFSPFFSQQACIVAWTFHCFISSWMQWYLKSFRVAPFEGTLS